MKDALKKIYYRIRPSLLPYDRKIDLAYIFHTEQIFDLNYFETLLRFCTRYQKLTDKKPICTLMTGVNSRVQKGCHDHRVSESEYAERARRLAEVSTLGYHGHFWIDPYQTESGESQMKGTLFSREPFLRQFFADLEWFQKHQISHHGLYAGGWWFMNESVLQALLQAGFKADFSFSQAPYFRNPYSYSMMKKNEIPPGQAFLVRDGRSDLLCIQNFIGCHPSPFVGDFTRNLSKMIGSQKEVIGVVNSHDYDLQEENTLRCIEAVLETPGVKFLSADEIVSEAEKRSTREIFLSHRK